VNFGCVVYITVASYTNINLERILGKYIRYKSPSIINYVELTYLHPSRLIIVAPFFGDQCYLISF